MAIKLEMPLCPPPQDMFPYKLQAPITDFLGQGQFLMFSWVRVQELAKETILESVAMGALVTPSKIPWLSHVVFISQG